MKKLLFRIVLGFLLGISLLMVAYLGIYYVAGQDTFNSLILKLTDINVFQNQILIVGLSGIMISFAVYIIEKTLEEDKKSPKKSISSLILLLLSFFASIFLIKSLGTFDVPMQDMLIIIFTVLFSLYCLLHCVQEAIDEFIINRKIKEKNS